MDAQNANEAAPPKPSASSALSRPPDSDRHDRQKPAPSSAVAKSPTLSRAPPPSKDAKPSTSSTKSPPLAPASNEPSKTPGSKSSSTALPRDPKEPKDFKDTKSSAAAPSREKQPVDDGVTDGSSEAETIVLSKDGSPAKPRHRKVIKHEDKSNGASSSSIAAASADNVPPSRRQPTDKRDGQSDRGNRSVIDFLDGPTPLVKKKKLHDKLQPSSNLQHARGKNPSSSLSSVPGSPPRSRNASSHPQSGSDTDHVHRPKSPRRALSTASKDRLRPPEKLVPYKRKATKYDSDDDVENHKVRRQRLANANAGANIEARSSKDSSRSAYGNGNGGSASLMKSLVSRSSRDESLNRSESPPQRSHRRSLSTHATSLSNGVAVKKKRMPAPLQTTDYNSDESSTSGSPRVRSAKLRNLAAPTTAESSPAKTVAHKKHLDAHGQTYLARACARGEYDLAKKRLQERPEDLNVADFAGNTPLQIAALNGFGNIVKLLIDAGCNLDCVNHDKDTPLLDAVDNGHLEVVQLLLDAGVNPRKANVNGEEPLDRVDDSVDNADAIRTALVEAKKNDGGRRFTSEEHRHENDDLRFLQGLDESPRRSPAPGGSSSSRRTGTIRATKTSNHLLYMPMDDKTLRLAAGRGDEQNVIRILQVREAFDDPESMVAASRGGHDVVLQLLLALGRANPDPAPITNVPPEHATPILAAIGQENLKVVSLLLEQSNFDPTKRFNGETYYEIARKRAGPNWREEEDILKKAYDNYKKHNGNKTKSPSQKSSESRRASRAIEPSDEMTASRVLKRKLSSPSLERPRKTILSMKATASSSATGREEKDSSKQKRTDSSISHTDRHSSPKRASSSTILAKTKPRDDRSSVTSTLDRDTPPPSKQVSKSRKTDSDSVAMSSEGETKPRRKKLVSGRELKDVKVREKEKEREKQRRSSLASTNTATPSKDSASPHESRSDDVPTEKARVDKHRDRDRDRARQLKKEDFKDSSGSTGESAGKRHRLSETPPNAISSDKDGSEAPVKRRRLEADNAPTREKEKKSSKMSAVSDDVPSKYLPSISVSSSKAVARRREGSIDDRKSSLSASTGLKAKKREASSDRARKELSKSSVAPIEKSIHVKSEDVDAEMVDVSDRRPSNGSSAAAEAKAHRDKDEEKKKKAETDSKKKEEELQRRRKDEEDKKKELDEKKKDEEKRKREEEEAERHRQEEEKKKKEAEAKKRKESEERKKKEDEEKLKRKRQQEEEERQRKEAERKRKEEEEQKKREEAELKRAEEERARKLKEEQRKQREEEERLQKEQLARETAAREAQRKRAEEERLRREQEQQERQERQERERIRAEKEAEERRLQLEERERHRIASLPPLLRWLSAHPNPRQTELATLFKVMQGVRYDCINTNANGTAEGREQWLINTQVALLFGDKDLELSRFPSWDRLPASRVAKQIIWNLESDRYALTDPLLFDLGHQLPGFYGAQGPRALGSMGLSKIRNDASDKFFATDMFFVKVADVMATIPSLPHLHDVRMAMEYRELPEHESQLLLLALNPKWKSDPDADKNLGFAPGTKYFVNGTQIGENRAGLAKDSKTPPRAVRVPRRGFVSVPIDDPEFELICKEQSIDPFSFPAYNLYKSKLQNGVPKVNGLHPMTNGTSVPLPNGQAPQPTVNGSHSTTGI